MIPRYLVAMVGFIVLVAQSASGQESAPPEGLATAVQRQAASRDALQAQKQKHGRHWSNGMERRWTR
jgi:hypothetical protein